MVRIGATCSWHCTDTLWPRHMLTPSPQFKNKTHIPWSLLASVYHISQHILDFLYRPYLDRFQRHWLKYFTHTFVRVGYLTEYLFLWEKAGQLWLIKQRLYKERGLSYLAVKFRYTHVLVVRSAWNEHLKETPCPSIGIFLLQRLLDRQVKG
jgi:hypothetical protein